ncbi:YbaK/EbsC family protein [Campylobacter mucosalis]|uniref:YbaK-like protein YeaK n=1 Tax=Campylobacter mucosalis CCUG 21559 TaxID=1032067 RepID=A0A6G5QFY0_9BACT|nr:YbaK/EbsC family protein [Campylobacter mucosalis]QCD44580.1 YbaK-like protein YeaK [Campylobacter mucosalis CCUG 21559]
MSEAIFNKIKELLEQNGADFRVVEHESVGTSEEVAKARKIHLGQGAKALVCTIKGAKNELLKQFFDLESDTNKINVIAILPADHNANLERLAAVFDAKKASLASPAEVSELTDCVFGAIPPFSFNEKLFLVVDRKLFGRFSHIAFNAGLLDHSIILNADDYLRIVKPKLIDFAHLATEKTL